MPFEKRNIRQSLKKKEREEFFSSLPRNAKKRFETISEKMKSFSFFSDTKTSEKTPENIPEKSGENSGEVKREKSEKIENSTNSLKKPFTPIDFIAQAEQAENLQKSGDAPEKIPEKKSHTKKSKYPAYKEYPRKTFQTFVIALLLIGIYAITIGSEVKNFITRFSSENIVETTLQIATEKIGIELKKDFHDRTNILILGSGGANHDGSYLTDSIIVLSLNHSNQSISMLSIPRDLYVDYRVMEYKRKGKINQLFRDGVNYWKYRVTDQSQVYANADLIIEEKVEEIIQEDIHYAAFVSFDGFERIVDELGGVTVTVEKRIYDPEYPGPNYSYQTFVLEEGLQTLDGETALKYVRSRHGTSGGDFGRSARQKSFILALKNQVFENNTFSSPEKITALLDILGESFWTNMELGEMVSALAFAKNISKDSIVSFEITDNVESGVGGFLYTPDRDTIENRMSVFLPYLSGETKPFGQISFYWEVLSLYPFLANGEKNIEVYNTTNRAGLAASTAQNLLRYGIKNTIMTDEVEEVEVSQVQYVSTPQNETIVTLLKRKLDMEFVAVSREEFLASDTPDETPDAELVPLDEAMADTDSTHVNEDEAGNEADEDESTRQYLPEDTFKVFIGTDFRTNPYSGTLIRRPLDAKIENAADQQFLEESAVEE